MCMDVEAHSAVLSRRGYPFRHTTRNRPLHLEGAGLSSLDAADRDCGIERAELLAVRVCRCTPSPKVDRISWVLDSIRSVPRGMRDSGKADTIRFSMSTPTSRSKVLCLVAIAELLAKPLWFSGTAVIPQLSREWHARGSLVWGSPVVANSAQFSTIVSEVSDQRYYLGTELTMQTARDSC